MKRARLIALLALPLVGLAGGIALREIGLAGAGEWRIPISGFDPRDPLRGRYIAFAFDWQVAGDASQCRRTACQLCLARPDGAIVATIQTPGTACANRVDVVASAITVQPRFRPGDAPRFSSRLFVSETQAPVLEQQMQSQPMQMVAVLTRDGRLVNRRIEPAG